MISGPQKMHCEQCNQDFKAPRYLIQHYKFIHKALPPGYQGQVQFMCEVCSDFFMNKSSLDQHVKRKHSNEPIKVLHKPKPAPKQCPHCDKVLFFTLEAGLGTSIDLNSVDQVTTNQTWLF